MPPNASQGTSETVTGGCVGGPVDARMAPPVGEADWAVASRLAVGDGVAADAAADVICAGGGRTGLLVVAGWVVLTGGVVGPHTAWNGMMVGLCAAPAAYRHPSMSPSCSVEELAPTIDACQAPPWRW